MKSARILPALGLALGLAAAATTTASAASRYTGTGVHAGDANLTLVARHPGQDDFGVGDNDRGRGAYGGPRWRPNYSFNAGRSWLPYSFLNDRGYGPCRYSRLKWQQTGSPYWHNRYEACMAG
jgi:hypothetical protein